MDKIIGFTERFVKGKFLRCSIVNHPDFFSKVKKCACDAILNGFYNNLWV